MNIDYNVIATGLLAPVAVLAIKTLLDFSLAHIFVKYFWWLPVRGLFREKPPKISGRWIQEWDASTSKNFITATDTQSATTIKQFGSYCLAEYNSKNVKYRLFGKIKNSYLVGECYDVKQKTAYFGSFQLRILDLSTLEGKYIGHSRQTCAVEEGDWNWRRE